MVATPIRTKKRAKSEPATKKTDTIIKVKPTLTKAKSETIIKTEKADTPTKVKSPATKAKTPESKAFERSMKKGNFSADVDLAKEFMELKASYKALGAKYGLTPAQMAKLTVQDVIDSKEIEGMIEIADMRAKKKGPKAQEDDVSTDDDIFMDQGGRSNN